MSALRDNWRVVLLVILLLASMTVLFVPGATVGGESSQTEAPTDDNLSAADSDAGGWTNLQYGIQLDGGSRIRAPIVGNTTENVDVPDFEEADELETALSQRLDLDRLDVEVQANSGPNEPDSGTGEPEHADQHQ